jgi:spermidine synthase
VLWATLAFSGLLTMGYEVAWTRALVFSFGSTVYSFTLILVVFLLGLTLGSALFARLDGRVNGVWMLAASQFLAAASTLALAPLAARAPFAIARWAGRHSPAADLHLAVSALSALVIILLPATLMGIVFPLASRLLVEDVARSGRRIGTAYWFNTVGSITGSVVTGFLLIPALSLKGALLGLAGVQAVLATVLLAHAPAPRRVLQAAGAAGGLLVMASALLFAWALPGPSPFDGRIQSPPDAPAASAIVAHEDAVTASVSVVRTESNLRALRINGFEATIESGAAGAGYMPMMSHLPLLVHGEARRVLVICFGTGSTAGSVLLHPGVTVDAVDINRAVLAFAPLFHRTNHRVDQDPRARLIEDDGRNYLLRIRETYDVITSEPMPPTHAGVVSLYSREYYELARARLRPGGVLVQWLPFHLLTDEEARQIVRTVQDVFPQTTLWLHAGTGIVVARETEPIVLDWPRLARALAEPALARDLARLNAGTLDELVQLFGLGPAGVRAWVGRAPAITDDRPSLEFHAPRGLAMPTVGRYTIGELRALLDLHGRQSPEELPIRGASHAEAERARRLWQAGSAYARGDAWLSAGRPAEAERLFSDGLALVSEPIHRAEFLCGLAAAAEGRGDLAHSRAYVEECLAADPANQRGRALQVGLRDRR